MRLLAKTVVALSIACAGVVLAQAKPNFSGTWVDARGEVMLIKHEATSIMLGHPEDAHNPHHSQTYKLDGVEQKQPNVAHRNDTDITRAFWDGDRIVVVIRPERGGPQHKRVLSLQKDGTLLLEVTFTDAGKAEQTVKATLKKK